jgi:hypothetical protein
MPLAPLSSGAEERAALVGEHRFVDDIREATLEDAEGFHAAVTVTFASLEQ